MATLTELVTDVATLLNRPDLTSKITTNVKAATLFLHKEDYYNRDLFEYPIQFDISDYVQQLDVRSVVPRYRKISYARIAVSTPTPGANPLQGKLLKIITLDQVIDSYGAELLNTVYEAGEVLNIRLSEPAQYILFGFYIYPDITSTTYSSWIALDHPYAIVYKACAITAASLGMDQEANYYTKLYLEEKQSIMVSALAAKGE